MSSNISDMALRKLVGIPGETQKISVGAGLFLWVTINRGGKTAKTWYLRYYDAEGKRQRSKLGEYPAMSLVKAQAAAEDAKKAAKEGTRLAEERAQVKQAKRVIIDDTHKQDKDTFEAIANMWIEKKSMDWDPAHAKRQKERLVGNIFPAFGQMDINSITMLDIDNALQPVIARGARETAQRICTIIKSIFDYAETMQQLHDGKIIRLLEKYRKDMPMPIDKKHLYTEMGEEEIGKLLFLIEGSKMRWTLQTSVALRLAPYLIVRPGELCAMEWKEVDIKAKEWLIPGARMKAGRDHLVPLPEQAIALLLELRPYTGANIYVFPSPRNHKACISTNSLIQALRRIGYASTKEEGEAFTTHGFRGMASTTLHQHPAFNEYKSEWIEHQLAHSEKDKVKAAYNQLNARSYIEERRRMLQEYANYLDELRASAATS